MSEENGNEELSVADMSLIISCKGDSHATFLDPLRIHVRGVMARVGLGNDSHFGGQVIKIEVEGVNRSRSEEIKHEDNRQLPDLIYVLAPYQPTSNMSIDQYRLVSNAQSFLTWPSSWT